VLKQEIVIPDTTETEPGGKGSIVLSLTLPANELFSGSFRLTLPKGVNVDLSTTLLIGDLASILTLTIMKETDGSWAFTIDPQTVRFAITMVYSQVIKIGYVVDETVMKGTYEIVVCDLSFEFDDGTSIAEEEFPVQLIVSSNTGITELKAETDAYLYTDKLFINSPIEETIQVYSVNGVFLYSFQKPAGSVNYLIPNASGSVLIVKGSSGWIKKVMR
jgi:hypothetical protein